MIEVVDNSTPLPSLSPIKGAKTASFAQTHFGKIPHIPRKGAPIRAKVLRDSPLPHFVQAIAKAKPSPATLFKPKVSPRAEALIELRKAQTLIKQAPTALPPSAQLHSTLVHTPDSSNITSIHQAKPLVETVLSQYKELRHRVQIDEADTLKQFNDARVAALSKGKKEKQPLTQQLVKELKETESIFDRTERIFMELVGKEEMQANEFYQKIQERTENIDFLHRILGKINSSAELDLSDSEGKKSIERMRQLGVEIPEGKTKWNEEEKKLLKETVHGAKDSIEKFSQLERIKLQRVMQQVAHHYQAISNFHRLLRQVMDTIIHNIGRS